MVLPKAPEVSPQPVVDPSLNYYDRAAVVKAKDEYFYKQLVRNQEISIVRDKLKWCYRKEGVNHLENCRELAHQYLDLLNTMKSGMFTGFKMDQPSS
ncbi:hypothetical protein EDD86DRAFT_202831 [Gorgonomyces haynaldii]|nr:hypothetical protein EDD86DRAFT_202831 [Gorgonomyces haynaldii]